MHLMNGAQFLNATLAEGLRPITVILPLTKMYTSLQSQRLDFDTSVIYVTFVS